MKLYLVRHGDSLPGDVDDTRPLSPQGQADIQNIAHFLAPLNLQIAYLFQSHKYRAQETAKILSASIHITKIIETHPELAPHADINLIIEEFLSHDEDTLLVGHMPFMGKLAGKLLAGDENKDILLFEPGCMVCLEKVGQSEWMLCWMLNPSLLPH